MKVMNDSSFKRVVIPVVCVIAILAAGSLYLFAKPAPSAPAPPAAVPNPPQATSSSSTQPKITWSPSAITVLLLPGDIKQRAVSFTSNRTLQNVSIQAVPEIASFVSLSVSKISFVSPNQGEIVQLQVTMPVIPSSSSFYGTIHVSASTSTIPQTLKMTIKVGLPADPGTAGNATLAGIDSDGDGVRDDVERYIGLTYPRSAKRRAALTQVAIALEDEVTGRSTGVQEITDALDCMDPAFMNNDADVDGGQVAYDAFNSLQAIVLNTPDRAKASVQAEPKGAVIQYSTPFSQKASKCIVNPSLFAN